MSDTVRGCESREASGGVFGAMRLRISECFSGAVSNQAAPTQAPDEIHLGFSILCDSHECPLLSNTYVGEICGLE